MTLLANPGLLAPALRERVHTWMYTLFTHHQNQQQAILRAAAARGFGLEPEKYVSQYPGSDTTTNIVLTPPSPMLPAAAPATLPAPTDGSRVSAASASPVVATSPERPVPVAGIANTQISGWWKTLLLSFLFLILGLGIGWGISALLTPRPKAAVEAPDNTWLLRILP
jgi:hypothetical protein